MHVLHEHFIGTSISEDVFNPETGDLILITMHCQHGAVNSVSYGGVTPEFVAASSVDWPQAFIYAIKKADLPASGVAQTLDVSLSGVAGAVTITKLAGAEVSDVSALNTNVIDNNTTSNNIAIPITTTQPSIIFGCMTHRDGCPATLTSDGESLVTECFEPPRGFAVAYRMEREEGEHELAWQWGTSGRRRLCVVEIPVALNTIRGTITDENGDPAQRAVYALTRPTDGSAPEVLAHGLSDPVTGEYELTMVTDEEVARVVVAEDPDANTVLNDLVDRVIPGEA